MTTDGKLTTLAHLREALEAVKEYSDGLDEDIIEEIRGEVDDAYNTLEKIQNIIEAMDVSDTADSSKYVSAVSESDGVISVEREEFDPSVTITDGTSSTTPQIAITVADNTSIAQSITTASTSAYGATKLTSTINSSEEGLAATPKYVDNAIAELNVSDTADSTKYVSSVNEVDGLISITREGFDPSITITAGTSSAAPQVNVTVAGNSGTAQSITTASTSAYGVTKLSSTTSSSEESLAATPAGVANAINELDATVSQSTSSSDGLSLSVTETNGLLTAVSGAISIDSSIDASSTKAVQNAVISAALDLKADLASPALTGTPTAPTAETGDSSTQIATTEFVQNTIDALGLSVVDGAICVTYTVDD